MNNTREYLFYVVEILVKKTSNSVCIPASWILYCNYSTQTAAVRYPDDLSDINRLVENQEPCSKQWPIYDSHLKYGTDAYEDAQDYIKMLIYSERNQRNLESARDGESSNKMKVNLEIDEQLNWSLPPGISINIVHSKRKHDPTDENLQTHVNKQSKSSSSNDIYNIQSLESSEASKNVNLPSIDVNNKTQEQKETLSAKTISKCNEQRRHILGADISDVKELLKSFDECFKQNQEMFHCLDLQYAKNISNVKTAMSILEEYNDFMNRECEELKSLEQSDSDNDEQRAVHSEPNEEIDDEENLDDGIGDNNETDEPDNEEQDHSNDDDGEEISASEQSEGENPNECDEAQEDEDDDRNEVEPSGDSDGDWNEETEYTNVRQGQPIEDFTLPPEYDEKDSKWTLRYRQKNDKLVELMPFSEIYVNRNKLNDCKRNSSDARELARNLCIEVFSDNAMVTCSVTGKKSNAFHQTRIRPGLDKHAVTVLMNYVNQYAYDNKWNLLNTSNIFRVLRNKLQFERCKYRTSPKRGKKTIFRMHQR